MPAYKETRGTLYKYIKNVSDASHGCVTDGVDARRVAERGGRDPAARARGPAGAPSRRRARSAPALVVSGREQPPRSNRDTRARQRDVPRRLRRRGGRVRGGEADVGALWRDQADVRGAVRPGPWRGEGAGRSARIQSPSGTASTLRDWRRVSASPRRSLCTGVADTCASPVRRLSRRSAERVLREAARLSGSGPRASFAGGDPPRRGGAGPPRTAAALALVPCLLVAAVIRAGEAPPIRYRIAAEYPHDSTAFTQGLVFDGGALYESTGLRGRSSLRKVDLVTGRGGAPAADVGSALRRGPRPGRRRAVPAHLDLGRAFVLRLKDFSLGARTPLRGGGLGSRLRRLVAGDERRQRNAAVPAIRRRSASSARSRSVTAPVPSSRSTSSSTSRARSTPTSGAPIGWREFDPASGVVTGWLDLSPIAGKERGAGEVDVANGIAWDGHRLYVTGKLWRSVYGTWSCPR